MSDKIEKQVRDFYENEGWVSDDSGVSTETRLFRELKGGRENYGEKVGMKPLSLLQNSSGKLLIVGGGDIPSSHTRAAEHFDEVVCIDISQRALDLSERKFGDKGSYYLASALDMPLSDNSVDAVLCAHMLYHVDRSNQEIAVDEMIRVTKPGGRILIIYLNPNAPLMLIQRFLKLLRINKLIGKAKLYVYSYPNNWWNRFLRSCDITILAHDAISTNQAKILLPTTSMRRKFFEWASKFEEKHSYLAVKLWSYVAIVLDKPAPKAQ